MKHYADSSFLVSCYIADRNTTAAKTWLLNSGVPLPFTELHALEVRNAFHLGVFRRLITSADVAIALADLRSDLRSGRLIRRSVDWSGAWRIAATLSGRHLAIVGARSLDILHVAAARQIQPGTHKIFGFVYFGRADRCIRCNSFVQTLWIVAAVPVIPLGSYRIISHAPGVLSTRRMPFQWRQVLKTAIKAWTGMGVFIGFLSR